MLNPLLPTMYKIPLAPTFLILASFSVSFLSGADSQTCAKFNLSDTPSFVDARLATQTINSRDYDPFGLPQNLDKKPTSTDDVPDVAGDIGEVMKPQLELQLNKLQGRVSIRGNGFLLGRRHFKVADQLNLKDGESLFSLEVISVGENVIQFRDLKSNELLKLKLGTRQLPKTDPLLYIPLGAEEEAFEL